MKATQPFIVALLFAVLCASCTKDVPTNYIENDVYSAGKQTTFVTGTGAYSQIFPF